MTPRDAGDVARLLRGQRILYVSHRLPYPPVGGAKVRAFHCIRHLARVNDVTVAAPVREAKEAAAARELAALGPRVETAWISRMGALARMARSAAGLQTASAGYFHAPVLVRRLDQLRRQQTFDLVVVHSSSVAPWVAHWIDVPKVLDFVDMDSQKWLDYAGSLRAPRSYGYRFEGWTLARLERRLARRFDLNITATGFEAETLRAIAGEVPHEVVPNGVDLDYFAPGSEAYDPNLVCFLGRMDYFPNALAMQNFCRVTWPLVRARVPEANLRIIGANPGRGVRALAALPGVEVTGTVPDVRPLVRRAACTVAPLTIARGTQNKVLESMAMGVPVVASSLAARGVDAQANRELVIADTPETTSASLCRLMTDPRARTRLARAGRDRAFSHHDWSTAVHGFERALVTVLSDASTFSPTGVMVNAR